MEWTTTFDWSRGSCMRDFAITYEIVLYAYTIRVLITANTLKFSEKCGHLGIFRLFRVSSYNCHVLAKDEITTRLIKYANIYQTMTNLMYFLNYRV